MPDSAIDIVTAFWLATLGGAAALDLPVGLLEVGRRFDAFVVDTAPSAGGMHVWPDLYGPEQMFEKIVRLAGPADIAAVLVDGRRVVDGPIEPDVALQGARGGAGAVSR